MAFPGILKASSHAMTHGVILLCNFFTLWGEVEPVNPLNTSLPFGLTHDMEIKFVNEEKTKII